jgi:GDP-L-fucose synthase
MREFLHVDDLAESVRYVMEYQDELEYDLINAGTGKDLTIKELGETVQSVVGHQGEIDWDSSKPEGTPRKLMDVSRAKELGWKAEIALQDGIQNTYRWFLEHIDEFKEVEIN